MSTITVHGKLGGDVVVREVNDKFVGSFSLAESHYAKGKGKDGSNYLTEWHKVTVWGPLAQSLATKIGKGAEVTVVGKRKMNTYKNKEGVVVEDFQIDAQDVYFDRKSVQGPSEAVAADDDVPDLDDMPFNG